MRNPDIREMKKNYFGQRAQSLLGKTSLGNRKQGDRPLSYSNWVSYYKIQDLKVGEARGDQGHQEWSRKHLERLGTNTDQLQKLN